MQVYGADTLWRQLQREGIVVDRCTVERLMPRQGLRGVTHGKVVRTAVSDSKTPCTLDRVNRQFRAERPNQLWVSDFNYVSSWQGWLYVAFVIDVFASCLCKSRNKLCAARHCSGLRQRCTLSAPPIRDKLMYPAPFEYQRASTLREAAQMLARLGPDAKVLAGGQTLIPMMKLRLLKPSAIVDIGRIAEAKGIRRTAAALEIGGLTSHEAIAKSPEAGEYPILRDCAGGIADAQVRSLGTIAGSLAEADPSSCWPTLLIALDASVQCVSPEGERVQKVCELLKDAYTPALGASELIGKVAIDLSALAGVGAFVAFKRAAAAYPTASCALQLRLREGIIVSARLAIGCVGLTPIVVEVNAAAGGRKLSSELADQIGAMAAAQCDPLSDNRGSADYKRILVRGLVRRAFRVATARALRQPEIPATHTYYG